MTSTTVTSQMTSLDIPRAENGISRPQTIILRTLLQMRMHEKLKFMEDVEVIRGTGSTLPMTSYDTLTTNI